MTRVAVGDALLAHDQRCEREIGAIARWRQCPHSATTTVPSRLVPNLWLHYCTRHAANVQKAVLP